jgi:hypothetical protein
MTFQQLQLNDQTEFIDDDDVPPQYRVGGSESERSDRRRSPRNQNPHTRRSSRASLCTLLPLDENKKLMIK